MVRTTVVFALLAFPAVAAAADPMAHGSVIHRIHSVDDTAAHAKHREDTGNNAPPVEAGQGAFAAIGEIVGRLMARPDTDWTRVDIEALRQHLIDMDAVTLGSSVEMTPVNGGARFAVTSTDVKVSASIRRMVASHVATMNGEAGWTMSAEEIDGGAVMIVTGSNPDPIRGLGFIGLMTVGMHHQAHHLAIATGGKPHDH